MVTNVTIWCFELLILIMKIILSFTIILSSLPQFRRFDWTRCSQGSDIIEHWGHIVAWWIQGHHWEPTVIQGTTESRGQRSWHVFSCSVHVVYTCSVHVFVQYHPYWWIVQTTMYPIVYSIDMLIPLALLLYIMDSRSLDSSIEEGFLWFPRGQTHSN